MFYNQFQLCIFMKTWFSLKDEETCKNVRQNSFCGLYKRLAKSGLKLAAQPWQCFIGQWMLQIVEKRKLILWFPLLTFKKCYCQKLYIEIYCQKYRQLECFWSSLIPWTKSSKKHKTFSFTKTWLQMNRGSVVYFRSSCMSICLAYGYTPWIRNKI